MKERHVNASCVLLVGVLNMGPLAAYPWEAVQLRCCLFSHSIVNTAILEKT